MSALPILLFFFFYRMVLLLFPLQVLFPAKENLAREAILRDQSTRHAGEGSEESEGACSV